MRYSPKALLRRAIRPLARALVRRAGRRLATVAVTSSAVVGGAESVSRLLLKEAQRRHSAGDSVGSHALLEVFVPRSPGSVRAALDVTAFLRRTGDVQRAVVMAREVIGRPDLPDRFRPRALAELARAEDAAGDPAAAVTHLGEALAADPGQQTWRRTLAGWHFRTGREEEAAARWDPAAAAYRRALELDDTRAWWHFRLGHVLDKTGRWDAAAAAFVEAVARNDSHPSWQERLVRARYRSPGWALAQVPDPRPDGRLPERAAGGVVGPPVDGVVIGWIPMPDDGDDRIVFSLNGVAIADTRATKEVETPGGLRLREFRRNLREVWSHSGPGDVLRITHADRALYIVDSGEEYAFDGTDSTAEQLVDMVRQGYVLNKYGRVRRPIREDEEWQSSIFELFERLRTDLAGHFGLTLFPFFGTMLGAVREQDFIGHDNDFDTIYISGHSSPEEVRGEFRRLCAFLIDRGYQLRVKKTHTWVKVPGTEHKLDIFYAWFDADDYFQTSYGHHGKPVRRSDAFFQFRTEKLGSWQIPVPRNAENILAQLYGDGWREPDPGFTHFSTSRVIRTEYQLGLEEANEAHWRQFYRRVRSGEPSSFAGFVATQLPRCCTVLDIGCGAGRDSIFLASRGHTVVGADRSAEAIARAREASQHTPAGVVRFAQLDASSRIDIERFIESELPTAPTAGELVVYLRFFLHSVDESTEGVLLGSLVDLLPGDFRLWAEFRTIEDGRLRKVHSDHYRRYIDERRLAEKLRRTWGFAIKHLEAGRGLSPYGDEDPHLARIMAMYRRAGDSRRITGRSPDGREPVANVS